LDVLTDSVLITTTAFAASSLGHAVFEAHYTARSLGNAKLLYVHYAIVAAFTISVAIFLSRASHWVFLDLLWVTILCTIVHSVRLGLDIMDGASSRSIKSLVRHAADAVANLATISYVLISYSLAKVPLIWASFLLSSALIGKELWYRTFVDFELRRTHPRTATQGGDGLSTQQTLSTFQQVWNVVKSTYYVLIGFALVYVSLAGISPVLSKIILGIPRPDSPLQKSLGFAAANFGMVFKGDAPFPLPVILFFEVICAVAITINFRTIKGDHR